MSSIEPAEPADVTFPGHGEMARRMRAYPWAGSALGDPHGWSASLRTAVRICLTSRFPMIVWWGPDLWFLYNDAYLPLMGTKHPALARPGKTVWPEIWDTIGPMLSSVMSSGQATWSEDLLLPMDRHGYWEETYWTYSYSPLHDDDGIVRGVFTAVSDTTERVIGGRRLAALQDLGAQAGSARSVAEACELVVTALERARRDVPFAAIYLRRPGSNDAVLAASSPEQTAPAPLRGRPGWLAGPGGAEQRAAGDGERRGRPVRRPAGRRVVNAAGPGHGAAAGRRDRRAGHRRHRPRRQRRARAG